MNIKPHISLASIMAAGLLASGCSQMSAQQVAQAAPVATPAPVVKTIVDCSKCARPAARPAPRPRPRPAPRPRSGGGGNAHTHPAIPGCTNSVRHNHKFTNRNHRHAYSCKRGAPAPVYRPAPMPAPAPVPMGNAHTHPAIPGCTNSITHNHPYNNPNHTHRYSCKQNYQAPPMMPKVKAKGTYRGPIQIDGGVMQQYQQ